MRLQGRLLISPRQGGQKGTQEEALRIARMMLENGIDRDLVRLITGLLPDDVTE